MMRRAQVEWRDTFSLLTGAMQPLAAQHIVLTVTACGERRQHLTEHEL